MNMSTIINLNLKIRWKVDVLFDGEILIII